jgi:hypothetical protein
VIAFLGISNGLSHLFSRLTFAMKIAYFDCFSGISGDMILGALIDLGLGRDRLQAELDKLELSGYQLEVSSVTKGGIRGSKVEVKLSAQAQPVRNLAHIQQIIEPSSLASPVKRRVCQIFQRLAEAEARVHGIALEKVHFHELGAIDTIVDVVGAVAGLSLLGVEQVIASPINVGSGLVDTEHGRLPVPAPAALELLKGASIYSSGIDLELATPTGAAIITGLAQDYREYPPMRLEAIGYGAGGYSVDSLPNMLRIALGEEEANYLQDQLIVLEADIDDMNPEWYAWVMERAAATGALDVSLTPIYMKHNRPASRLTLLSPPHLAHDLAGLVLAETTTLGVRFHSAHRIKLERQIEEVETEFGRIRVKIASVNGKVKNIAPEYQDCRRLARRWGKPLKEIYQAAMAASSNLDR